MFTKDARGKAYARRWSCIRTKFYYAEKGESDKMSRSEMLLLGFCIRQGLFDGELAARAGDDVVR